MTIDKIPEKWHDDLAKLEKIAGQQNSTLNLSAIMLSIDMNVEYVDNIINYFENLGIEVITTDIEPDASDSTMERLDPFDPSLISIRIVSMTIDTVVKRIEHNEFEFDSAFQRKAGLWNNTNKSQLIESILLRVPLPAFYFDASDDNKWLIIDGLQRVSTLREFIVDKKMKLTGMEFFEDLNGLKYDALPRPMQRRIAETNIVAYIVDPMTPSNAKFSIFKRINTGGLVLSSQEIRNALYQGKATEFLSKLAKSDVFLLVTGGSIPSDRMLDREFCLRFVAFNYLPIDLYNGVIDDFLNLAMEELNKASEMYLNRIYCVFEAVLQICYAIFGEHAFRKMSSDGRKRPINKGLFETWTHVIRQSQKSHYILMRNADIVVDKFISLCTEHQFYVALRDSHPSAIRKRIELIDDMLREVVEHGGDNTNDN